MSLRQRNLRPEWVAQTCVHGRTNSKRIAMRGAYGSEWPAFVPKRHLTSCTFLRCCLLISCTNHDALSGIKPMDVTEEGHSRELLIEGVVLVKEY